MLDVTFPSVNLLSVILPNVVSPKIIPNAESGDASSRVNDPDRVGVGDHQPGHNERRRRQQDGQLTADELEQGPAGKPAYQRRQRHQAADP